MEKFENEKFKINYDKEIESFIDEIIVSPIYKEILDFFEIKDFPQVTANLFVRQEDFIKYLTEEQGMKDIPSYCRGTFDKNLINQKIDPSEKVERILGVFYHELVHVVYKEIYDKRVVWFDEGLAQNISGQYDWLKDRNQLKQYFKRFLKNNEIVDMNKLKHGKEFVTDKYNGYALSHICVRYMIDTMSHKDILDYAKSAQKLLEVGENVLEKAKDFYNSQLELGND